MTRPIRPTRRARPTLHVAGQHDPPAGRVDELSASVVTEAIDTLAALRTTYRLGDGVVHLHALTSLIAQAQQLLPDAVRQARDQDLTWTQIGQLLNLTASSTARRYRQNPSPLDQEDHPHNADERLIRPLGHLCSGA